MANDSEFMENEADRIERLGREALGIQDSCQAELLENLVERIDVGDTSRFVTVELGTSSKGNQNKWYDRISKRYIKEQFLWQGKLWMDYKVERISSLLGEQLDTLGVKIVQQRICQLSNGKFGVVSDDFCYKEQCWVPFARIAGPSFSCNREYPFRNWRSIIETVKEKCKCDITDYAVVMVVMDYLLLNEDRHLNNFGVLQEADGSYKVAPLFDFGLGLFEHDRMYEGLDYKAAYAKVAGKPFSSDLHEAVQMLYNCGYKEKICRIITPFQGICEEAFPNELGKEHFFFAMRQLREETRLL